jgi:hypothetical protein
MPTDDWQFWVATALALGGVLVVARPFLPKRRKSDAGCPGCPSGEHGGDDTPKPKRVDLTIGGKRVR